MERFADIRFDRLHHAYLIEGEREETLAALLVHLERIGIPSKGNPDVACEEYDAFLVEHARELRRRERYRSAGGGKKVFIVAFNTIMPEAENALLKTLEEPAAETHFFFVTRTAEALLPTVRSRMHTIRGEASDKGQERGGRAKQFLNGALSERMKMIDPWLRAKDEKKAEAKEEVRIFLDEIEFALRERFGAADAGVAEHLGHVIRAKTYLADRSPSLKLILEHLALTLPRGNHPGH